MSRLHAFLIFGAACGGGSATPDAAKSVDAPKAIDAAKLIDAPAVDAMIDAYRPEIEELSERLDQLEERVFDASATNLAKDILNFKKDVASLRKFISDRGKIRARRVTGNCSQHQRDIAIAVKNSREMALLPYTSTAR